MEEFNTYMSQTDYSEAQNFFIEKGKKRIFHKKDYLVHQNNISYDVSYVQEGIFHLHIPEMMAKSML